MSIDTDDVGISVVLPCLNEAGSVAACVERALRGIASTGLSGEVIVCDNGSTDGSADLATQAGATVVHESRRGYGSAYLRGFAAARGAFIVMGDADSSYDFGEIPNLLARLQDGYDYVVGSRFAGKILPGAMPWTHRYIGNPMLTGVLNRLFGTRLSDAHSGLRAMTRDAYQRLRLRCTGMELASEIAVRAAQAGLRAIEVPITYHPRSGSSKLRPLADGWRHLRFMAGMLPGLMMIVPGFFVLAAGVVAAVALQSGWLPIAAGYSLSLTIFAALVVLVSGQVVALGTATSLHSLSLPGETKSRLSRSIERALRSSALVVLGPSLFVLGLTGELVSLFSPASHHDILVAGHLRFSVISLATMMLGVQTAIAVSHLTRVRAGAWIAAAVAGALALAPPSADGPEPVSLARAGKEERTRRRGRLSL